MRALLVVNPNATSTSPRGRDVLARALASELKLDVAETGRRGHAAALAAAAVRDGLDLVVALGGDGTVNEVVNGLLGTAEADGIRAPALGVVPGGSANVFARSVGLPDDPVEATSELLAALRAERSLLLGVGRADERYFTFAAGLGWDAAAVRLVERARRRGRRSTPSRYLRAAVTHYLTTDRRHPPITLHEPGVTPLVGIYFGIVANTTPWTWFRGRPVVVAPRAGYRTGLDLFAMRRLGPASVLPAVAGMFSTRRPGPRGRGVVARHDLAAFTLAATRPMDFQVDGDYLGERESVTFRAVPDALRVYAPRGT